MAVLFLVVFALLLVGAIACTSMQDLERNSTENVVQETAGNLIYAKDHRVGLCFAFYHAGWYTGLMTEVPCEKVEHLLVNK
ncbi:MAG: hypothetical protein WC310_03530 [Patescibacteria group bacterium]